jgi:hypothetical protein
MRLVPGNDLVLGNTSGSDTPILLSKNDRDKHLYVCGSTGTGKSKFLENLIRQDIRNWNKSRCGLLLLDPHGSLYDNVVRWLSSRDIDRPVILVDLRQDEWVVGYNMLRHRPETDPAVIVNNFVQAMAYVWGQSGTDETPLFARWASNILSALYERKVTLVEALHLIDHSAKRMRYAITHNLSNRAAARDWTFSYSLTPKDFEAQISSTVNRLNPFLSTKLIRHMFGQSASLDLGKAMQDGHIILVNLATQGGRVSDEDSALFATVLLSDLWAEAKVRGKGSDGKPPKPFYVYCDEFQNFVTPTIARNLDQARGFGLHLTLAHQFPNQLLHAGAHGKQVYDSVFENARTKVVFSLESEENLRPLAQALFRGVLTPDKIRREIYSTKVMGYEEAYRIAYGKSVSQSAGGALSRGRVSGAGSGGTEVYTGEVPLVAMNPNDLTTLSKSDSLFASDSESESEAWGHSIAESEARVPMLIPKMGKELSSVENESIEDQLFRAMAILSDQQQRHCVVRIVGERLPVALKTPTLMPAPNNSARIAKFTKHQMEKWPFAISSAAAEQRIMEREKMLLAEPVNREPILTKRKLR